MAVESHTLAGKSAETVQTLVIALVIPAIQIVGISPDSIHAFLSIHGK